MTFNNNSDKEQIHHSEWKPIRNSGRPKVNVDEQAIKICYKNGMSIAEISRIYNCSETTVRRRLKRK